MKKIWHILGIHDWGQWQVYKQKVVDELVATSMHTFTVRDKPLRYFVKKQMRGCRICGKMQDVKV